MPSHTNSKIICEIKNGKFLSCIDGGFRNQATYVQLMPIVCTIGAEAIVYFSPKLLLSLKISTDSIFGQLIPKLCSDKSEIRGK